MLLVFSVVFAVGLIFVASAQCLLAMSFLRHLRSPEFELAPQVGDSQVGDSQVGDSQVGDSQVGDSQVGDSHGELKVAVILCLRGSDPFLADCLGGLLALDYTDYRLHVVVDHVGDPSVATLDRVLRENPAAPVTVHYLDDRRRTCSLKCSALIQAVNSLDASYDAIAQVDADTVVHAGWLNDLMLPLADPDVGAVTGNRWYMPNQVGCATMVRWLWNASAVVQMNLYGIPWGGTLAVRTSLIESAKLNERWARTFCEDTPLSSILADHGKRVVFNPKLLMVNRESTDLLGFCRWVSRQLLTVRLYHRCWPMVILHGFASTILVVGAIVIAGLGLFHQRPLSLGVTACGLLVYMTCNLVLMWRAEIAARRIVHDRAEATNWLPVGMLLLVPAFALLAQLVYQTSMSMTLLAKHVSWRGAKYRIITGGGIRLLEDVPYTAEPQETQRSL